MTYSWRFNLTRPSYKAREPIQGEFFAADAISNPGEALVREGIQNSLDARRNGERVMVRIRVAQAGSEVPRCAVNPFLIGLDEHLKAPGNGLREIPDDIEDCPALVFEDFGTTGLLGNYAEWNPTSGSHNHFYHFFRAEGLSDKGEKDRGRWGVGKQVFPRSSRINSIFGLTVRSDDQKQLLMGMAVLKSHNANGRRYTPDGLLGRPSGDGDDCLILPIEDSAFIDTFSRTFDIQRGNAPGLTVVVPWCDLELTDEHLVRAVLRGYFWPILREQLEVIIETGSIETILDASSLVNEIREIGNDLEREILPLVELATWANSLEESDFVKLSCPDPQRVWTWSKNLFPANSLNDLKERYERGEKIALRVPVSVREKNQPPRMSFFDVFLSRDGSEQNDRPVFIRQGIIIPDVRAPLTRGVRAIVTVEDGPIGTFLGDSENPAHTQWQKDGANFRGKYISGAGDLLFVIRSVHECVNIICEQDKQIDRSILTDLFSITAPPQLPDISGRDRQRPVRPGSDPERPVLPDPRPRAFIIDRVERGFVVRNSSPAGSISGGLLIRAAYQVRRGNPFKKYERADFDFAQDITTSISGATVLEKLGNRLLVRIDSNAFRIEVTGFDNKRDLRVEVRQQEVNGAGSDN